MTLFKATPLSVPFFLFLLGAAAAEDPLPPAQEPPLADSGWTVRYNELLVSCAQGSMNACDSVVSDRGMISGNAVYDYAATCGGRLDQVTVRRIGTRMFENGIRGGTCAFIWPSHP